MKLTRALRPALCLVISAAAACTGMGDGPNRPGDGNGSASGPNATPGGPGGPGEPIRDPVTGEIIGTEPLGPCTARVPARLVLLSDYQHLNSLKALLGATAVSATDAAENNAQTKPFAQKGVVVNASLVHTRLGWAVTASDSFAARFAELTSCSDTRVDDACAARFLASFAARAFRRPVDAAELADVMAVYNVGKVTSFSNGVKRAVEAILGAPSFMVRRELGAGSGTELTLAPHELASELSFLLSDQPPDAELSAAATSGALADEKEVERQVERLVQKREVQDSLSGTLISAWGLSNLFGTVKDPKLFPEYTAELQASMFHETELFVRDVLWDRKAPVSELLSARRSFVNKPLAAIYGVPFTGTGTEFVPVMLPPERAGLLTQASVMATLARTDTTSVVARGLFIRGAMLCLSKLPGPPETLAGEIQELLKADMTERQRAEVRKQNAKCGTCHAGIDPFGLMFESYDPLGRHRTTLKNMTIDNSADVTAGSLTGHYDDALAFVASAAKAPEFTTCMATKLLMYATQDEELKASDCQVRKLLENRAPAELTLPELVKAISASPALRLRKKEAL